MKMIEKLKKETRELHEQIEEKNLAKHILDHNIDLETYKLLLLQNYRAYSTTESEIKKFLPLYSGKKHLELQKDLEQLGVPVESSFKNDTFRCHSPAEALGAAYVVEGSALGGMVLAKNLEKCTALKEIDRHYFFSGDKENLLDWKNFKQELEQFDFSETQEQEAIDKAKDTFRFFSAVFEKEYQVS
ncbi:biliverdin-producing heme oxygenase [Salinimicrobium sediminilitoris]|uniref:biliverdin-producing heme oxygenase n=1 Tax=Salinimicrobium sediminilitoris TaxID=2876715 RepID=UPI001E5B61F8|nr:biliverdin-producing heme oxygenase [Salinimicrobium sediminilitoris]MCC8358980.1 biliverdin-producing heme oxygenase [Salinimicrobium sediminilitoris]